jgi:hypothetical protein
LDHKTAPWFCHFGVDEPQRRPVDVFMTADKATAENSVL